ncbi:MAG: GNAT family N-acetyltransferase [Dehalococcoidia bacterium]
MDTPVTHWQIDAREPARLHRFYGGLFEWEVEANNALGYGLVTAQSGGISGGIGPARGSEGVTIFVEVDDLQAFLDRAERLGGKTLMQPTTIPGAVTMAMIADPEGNRIGLLKGRTRSAKSNDAEPIAALEIKELTPALLEDYLNFFDKDAFADNPAWASCYCLLYHVAKGRDWPDTGRENRAERVALICSGRAHGLLAYVDGQVAGWCNAEPRTDYPGLDRMPGVQSDGGESVGSIVCFVISPSYRRHGLARRLLDAACDSFRRQGLAYAEAYPAKDPKSDAEAFHGPPGLYLAAGFSLHRELDRFLVVRKQL